MSKIDKLTQQAQSHLDVGERIESVVMGQYETKRLGSESMRSGVLIATDRRLVFYAKKLTGYELESFPYGNISSFETGKNLMGHYYKFMASGNEVALKWINGGDIQGFAGLVRGRVGGGNVSHAAPQQETSGGVEEALQQLRSLRSRGLISEQEYQEKRADLLSRL